MQLGIGSYTLAWAVGVPGYAAPSAPLEAEGLVEQASRLGVRVVQICDNLPLHLLPAERLDGLAARAGSAGVALEVGTRGTEPAHLLSYLRTASALGARLVRSLITKEVAAAERELLEVLPAYEKAGVVLALENYERHGVRALAELIQRIASPCLGACLDTVNSLGALETPREAISALLPHTASLHLKDFDITRNEHRLGFSVLGTPAGQGRLDIPELVNAARNNGRDPNAILELWTPYTGTVDDTVRKEMSWAEESISFLRRFIKS